MNKELEKATGFVAIGLAGPGVYLGKTDDAPGAALLGFLLAVGVIALAVRMVRRGANGEAPR